jgi:hypothetical protein
LAPLLRIVAVFPPLSGGVAALLTRLRATVVELQAKAKTNTTTKTMTKTMANTGPNAVSVEVAAIDAAFESLICTVTDAC